MSTEANETKKAEAAGAEVAKSAPTEQQESRAGKPKRFAPGQTVCNEKNEKNKLCNGHLKQLQTQHPAEEHLRGDDALHQCQTCGALYMGPPLGHLRDSRRQQRFVERDLTAILQAAGGTLPAYDYPRPYDPPRPGALKPAKVTETKTPPAATAEKPAATAKPATATPAPAGETPEQKKARLIAEHKAKLAAKAAQQAAETSPAAETAKPASANDKPTPATEKPATAVDKPAAAAPSAAPTETPAPAADSSAEADRHRPAAEAQAATGQASAAPMSPAAATASPAAGAETVEDLAPEASTELTPGAPKDERS